MTRSSFRSLPPFVNADKDVWRALEMGSPFYVRICTGSTDPTGGERVAHGPVSEDRSSQAGLLDLSSRARCTRA